MDSQQSSNPLAKSTHHNTTEVNTSSTIPHFDFILPSYSRDRRLSLPETIVNDGSINASFSTAEQNPSSSEIENNRKG
jgi:hypothetical protein